MLGHKIISESLEMLSALQTRVFRHVQAFKSLHDGLTDRLSSLCNLTF